MNRTSARSQEFRAADVPPMTERIRRRAYELFLERRGGPGDALSDWLQAERELNGGPGARAAQKAGSAPASGPPRPAARAEILLHGVK